MTPDRILHVANAVAAMLNASVAPFDNNHNPVNPPQFTAARTYWIEYTNQQLATLHVDVRHPVVTTGEESRGGTEDTYGIEVSVQKQVDRTNQASVDALVILGRRCAQLFPVGSVIAGDTVNQTDGVQVIENLHVVFDPQKLAANQFFSLVGLTLREYVGS